MIVYGVMESLFGPADWITVSVFSTREKAQEAIRHYEKAWPDCTYGIEEMEVDKI